MDPILYLIDDGQRVSLVASGQPRLHVVEKEGSRVLQILEPVSLKQVPVPMLLTGSNSKALTSPSVVFLPVDGGGRGPVINNGQVIDLALLLTLLDSSISESQLTAGLNARLDALPSIRENNRSQAGIGTHDDTITLDFPWADKVPIIDLTVAPGRSTTQKVTTVVDIDYVQIPEQEMIFGHTGIVVDNQFTIKAAILEYAAPTDVVVNWSPADIVCPPATALSTESIEHNTAVNCMGFRVTGSIGLASTASPAVAGAMYLQMQVDGGAWVTVTQLWRSFDVDDATPVSVNFDEFIVADQAAHTYKFRGYLVIDPDADATRELTGSITVDTVAESGSGTILSNDLLVKWSAKE